VRGNVEIETKVSVFLPMLFTWREMCKWKTNFALWRF